LAVATAAAPPSADITSFLPADVVTFRAVENFDRTLPLAARFLGPNSRLAVLIGSAQLPKLNALPNMKWQTIPVPHSRQRVLSIGHLA
jgi:16S rRNA G527 N7-methylase RsmG